MDGGPLSSDLDAPDASAQVVGILASSDNPTASSDQAAPVRAVAVTADGGRTPVQADWVALDGGELRDTVVNSKHLTYSWVREPGNYRLVSFDRGKKFRDTTRVTVPRPSSMIIPKPYLVATVGAFATVKTLEILIYSHTSAVKSWSLWIACIIGGLRLLRICSRRFIHAKPWYMPQGERRRSTRKCAHRRRESDHFLTRDLHIARLKLLISITIWAIPRVKF
jgi:hypothetical protein